MTTPEGSIYNIDYIIRSKTVRNSKTFLVKWEGYPISESTWEPLSAIRHTQPYLDFINKNEDKKPSIAKSKAEDLPPSFKTKCLERSDKSESISQKTPPKLIEEPTNNDSEYDLLEIIQSIFIKGVNYYFVEAVKKDVGTKKVIITDARYINSKARELLNEFSKRNNLIM